MKRCSDALVIAELAAVIVGRRSSSRGSRGFGHELATNHIYGASPAPNPALAGGAKNGEIAGKTARAGTGTRTRDPLFTRQVLYQLSYSGGAGPA
jgi:hypothetical protein